MFAAEKPVAGLKVPENAPTSFPAPTSTPSGPRPCSALAAGVPASAIADALANPERIPGWNSLCNPGLPPGPLNARRLNLGLQNPEKPFHPLFNGLAYKCGCP